MKMTFRQNYFENFTFQPKLICYSPYKVEYGAQDPENKYEISDRKSEIWLIQKKKWKWTSVYHLQIIVIT